jgi:hypothetical protein
MVLLKPNRERRVSLIMRADYKVSQPYRRTLGAISERSMRSSQ